MGTVARILRIPAPSLLALLVAGVVGTSGALAASPAPSAPVTSPAPSGPAASPTSTGNVCPQVLDAAEADYYPVQPSFSAGYSAAAQHAE